MLKKSLPYIKEFTKRADMLLFSLCAVSSLLGLVLIASATAHLGTSQHVIVQFSALIIGFGLFALFTVIDIDILADKWAIIFAFCMALLVILQIFGQDDGTGNKSWLRFLGIGIQPSEVIKVAFIVLMGKHISYLKEYKRLDHVFSIAQLLVHFGIFFGLIVIISSDLGSALIFFSIFLIMLFFAGLKLYWFILGATAIAGVTPLLWTYFLRADQKLRIMAPYDITIDPLGTGVKWQNLQSKIALSSGRLTGTGLFNGPQTQSGATPEQHNDFIFAVIGEELGMIGCCVTIALLLAIIIRCVYIGINSRNTLSMLVCLGVAGMLFFQTFENIGMCIGLTPVIGLTLPFFSYGGSSAFTLYAAIGLVSGVKYRPKPERFRKYG